MSELKMKCDVANVPIELKELKKWTTWGSDPKVPKAPSPAVGHAALSFEKALGRGVGIGIFLGDGLAGIDLDGCRDPESGVVDEWAEDIVTAFGSYCEVSPSGTGLKLLCFGTPVLERKQAHILGEKGHGGKTAAIEAYCEGRYFTITGNVYGGYDEVVKVKPALWTRVSAFIAANKGKDSKIRPGGKKGAHVKPAPIKAGGRNNQFYGMACGFASAGIGYEEALKIIRERNALNTDEPLEDSEIVGVVNNGYKQYDGHAWVKGAHKNILPTQENIIVALESMDIQFKYDEFRDRKIVSGGAVVDDFMLNGLWLDIEKKWKFRANKDYFWSVCDWLAHENTFHPVQDFLNGVKWDGVKRLEGWLMKYGGAESEFPEYLRWISKCVIVAAVKRVFEPGCKFDEMVVIQGEQGCGKSMAVRALCMNDEWFSDDLPLGSESKIVVERTVGKWIIEAAELTETRGNKIEILKSFLSRGSERARLAWGREPVDRRRHFIIIGTTNDDAYLKDITGDRRFWPVVVKKFDLPALIKVREQLWAEAVVAWKSGFSIRMPEKLYPFATAEQNKHKEMPDWAEALEELLNGKSGWFMASDVRDWFLAQRWSDYSSYPLLVKHLKMMGWKAYIKKHEGTTWRAWWKGDVKGDKVDLYSKPTM